MIINEITDDVKIKILFQHLVTSNSQGRKKGEQSRLKFVSIEKLKLDGWRSEDFFVFDLMSF